MYCLHRAALRTPLPQSKRYHGTISYLLVLDPRDSLRCAITELIQLTDASLRRDISWAAFHHGSVKREELFTLLSPSSPFFPLFSLYPPPPLRLVLFILAVLIITAYLQRARA